MATRDGLYNLYAVIVNKYVQARDRDLLPDHDTEQVLGMRGNAGRELYHTFKTLTMHGRFSSTLLEQAFVFAPTGYPEYIELLIRSLPPRERSMYAANLYNGNFANIQWDTDLYVNTHRNLLANEPPAIPPAIPLGDNRHTPRMAYIAKIAFDFHEIINLTVIYKYGSLAGDVYAPLKSNYVSDIDGGDVLEQHGSVFGLTKSELDWSGARADTGRTMSISETVLRAWNALYFCERLCKTELELALAGGPDAMKTLFSTAVRLSRSMFCKPQYTCILDQALGVINAVQFTELTIPEDAEPNWECDYCGKENQKSMCSRCNVAVYCSRDCQKKDWRRHRPLCARYVNKATNLGTNCDQPHLPTDEE